MNAAWQYVEGTGQALALLGASGSLAFALGLILTLADTEGPRALRPALRATSWLFQTTPPLILLFLAFYGSTALGWSIPALLAATIAFTTFSTAYYYEIFRAAWAGVPPGQTEAARALGVPRLCTLTRVTLGERGPVWWDDGAPDLTRKLARNTCYAEWFAALAPEAEQGGARSRQ